ncbi:MAG: hypothetical protein V4504_02370 [Patescibacteria group bacterium]
MRKINIDIKGLRFPDDPAYNEALQFFKQLNNEIDEYFQSKKIKINFSLSKDGRTDGEIIFESHDEEEYPAPPTSIFDDVVITTLIEKNVRGEFKINKDQKIRFRDGSISRFHKHKSIKEEIVPAKGQTNHVSDN